MRLLFLMFLLSCTFWVQAQCAFSISGKVLDEHHDEPLEYSTVLIEETGGGAVADSTGFFILSDLCAGEYHLRVSHVGCEHVHLFVDLKKDTAVNIFLEHHSEHLADVIVKVENVPSMTQGSVVVSEEASGQTLSQILTKVVGVSSISNGSGIAKPVIHGLYGNRIVVLNNGLEQAGQRWGNDHAPEIDLNSGGYAKVIKGVASIPYGGNGLGGVILVDQYNIKKDPHVHGIVGYSLNTNGLGNNISARIEKSGKLLDWRLHGSALVAGDTKAPDYYLTNTGRREYTGGLMLERQFNDKWFSRFYYSIFNTDIGLLRGSHIGNSSDLEEAIGRDEPFFTRDTFSYNIENPFQRVIHHLVKYNSRYYFNTENSIYLQYGYQHNRRKEFDTRRGPISEFPALDLKLQAHDFKAEYSRGKNNTQILSGLSLLYKSNDNDPSTGTFPLIPDYSSYNAGLYFSWLSKTPSWVFEAGARTDFIGLGVFEIAQTIPYEINLIRLNYLNYSLAAGVSKRRWNNLKPGIQVGLTQRSPAVNELFSFGLHQGVSGIEQGDKTLIPETSVKGIFDLDYDWKEKIYVGVSVYAQLISDYIYLEPTDDIRLTIQGAFPVFQYKQTDASLSGFDVFFSTNPIPAFEAIFRYAIIRGWDRSNETYLVYMPSDNVSAEFEYALEEVAFFHEMHFGINGKYVFEQSRLEETQDFLAPPEGYFLLGAEAEIDFVFSGMDLALNLSASNLLDNSYRDYLNRLRYFADEQGVNYRLRLKLDF